MENRIMDGQTQVCANGSSKGGKVAGIVLGAIGVLGGIAAAVIYKKKKQQNEVEVESEVEESENE